MLMVRFTCGRSPPVTWCWLPISHIRTRTCTPKSTRRCWNQRFVNDTLKIIFFSGRWRLSSARKDFLKSPFSLNSLRVRIWPGIFKNYLGVRKSGASPKPWVGYILWVSGMCVYIMTTIHIYLNYRQDSPRCTLTCPVSPSYILVSKSIPRKIPLTPISLLL